MWSDVSAVPSSLLQFLPAISSGEKLYLLLSYTTFNEPLGRKIKLGGKDVVSTEHTRQYTPEQVT